MNNIFKTCVNSPLRSHHCLQNQQGLVNVISPTRSLYTSPVLQHPSKKRRKRHPFFWLQDKYKSFYDENLTSDNEQSLSNKTSTLKEEPWDTNEEFTDGSTRCGLIARKMGRAPMATCLMVSDNHVIKYLTPENYAKHGRPVDVVRYPGMGFIAAGSNSQDPREFAAEYNGLFTESGVMPEKKLTRFFITPNARMEPGTPLVASHFRPGMYVDIYGKSKWLGFVSLRRGFQLGRKTHSKTENHNRIGSIGRGVEHAGPLNEKQCQQIDDNLDLKVRDGDGETIVEAEPRNTGRRGLVVSSPTKNCGGCALCRLNLKGLKYTDVMILSQFIKRDGSMATIHESKLCAGSYHRVRRLIFDAQRCNLIKRPASYFRPGTWHDLNTYLERDRKRDQPMTVIRKEYWKV